MADVTGAFTTRNLLNLRESLVMGLSADEKAIVIWKAPMLLASSFDCRLEDAVDLRSRPTSSSSAT
jgi:hypothetical protein